jgi:hypothetical protein
MAELTTDRLEAMKVAAKELKSLLPFGLELKSVEEYKQCMVIMDNLVEDAVANELLIDILFPIILKYDEKIELNDVGDFFERQLIMPDLSSLELLNMSTEEWKLLEDKENLAIALERRKSINVNNSVNINDNEIELPE